MKRRLGTYVYTYMITTGTYRNTINRIQAMLSYYDITVYVLS